MPGSAASAPPAAATVAPPPAAAGLGENRAIKFHIKTGNNRWTCTLQDRSAYERTKASRSSSTDSVDSSASSTTSH